MGVIASRGLIAGKRGIVFAAKTIHGKGACAVIVVAIDNNLFVNGRIAHNRHINTLTRAVFWRIDNIVCNMARIGHTARKDDARSVYIIIAGIVVHVGSPGLPSRLMRCEPSA